jgi:hypothetical protein
LHRRSGVEFFGRDRPPDAGHEEEEVMPPAPNTSVTTIGFNRKSDFALIGLRFGSIFSIKAHFGVGGGLQEGQP